eukprot:CAMPEP_0175074034 /NCGR_PEP_ID=MMETSP0052_2-20121109/20997_1 /TAXON_ID=51329 ORGANISM="Polytomella parva, Strain SAG 63-3" /NCGR_SAMPLE_ID=MMETSP0052_2 /ASSEMBLY_ACC=CAM_ASM_000194 /LENGTH=313 /DNA_ID=CAMNT_0016342117 /DNA_START=27 /DNA_END=964 /DNA_ORIENTATION=+
MANGAGDVTKNGPGAGTRVGKGDGAGDGGESLSNKSNGNGSDNHRNDTGNVDTTTTPPPTPPPTTTATATVIPTTHTTATAAASKARPATNTPLNPVSSLPARHIPSASRSTLSPSSFPSPLSQLVPLASAREEVAYLQVLRVHSTSVTAMCYNPSGQILATAADDGSACLWDAASGSLRLTIPMPVVCAPASSSNSSSASSTTHSPLVDDLGFPLAPVYVSSYAAAAISSSPSSSSGSGSNSPPLPPHSPVAALDMSFSPSGLLLSMACRDGQIRIWQLTHGSIDPFCTLACHVGPVSSVAFRPDGRCLVST